MSFGNLFKIGYYFDSTAAYTFSSFWGVVAVLVVILIISFWQSQLLQRNKHLGGLQKKLLFEWVNLGYLVSIIGLAWLFFRYQGINYFNWRFWPTVLLIFALVKSSYLVYYQKRILPQKMADRQSEVSQSYYLRRRRKR